MKKKKIKTLPQAKAKTWEIFSLWVRLVSADKNGFVECYTCGKKDLPKYMQAGHAIGGRHNAVIFDYFLVQPQCAVCNIFNKGEYGKFAAKLIAEFGLEWYDEKQRLCGKSTNRVVKYTRCDLEEIAEFCREEIKTKTLEKSLIPERIDKFWPVSKDMR